MLWPLSESELTPVSATPEPSSRPMPSHVSVLVSEVLEALGCAAGKNYLDLTIGAGGHARRILEATSPKGLLLGSDRDVEALETARHQLRPFWDRIVLVHRPLKAANEILRDSEIVFDGALIDCGVSSDQLNNPERGFSFQRSGPLDMRLDRSTGATAREWITRTPERKMAEIFRLFGEERYSNRIARAITTERRRASIRTTTELAEIVRGSIPFSRGRIHPATRTFQAIRIAVNNELVELDLGIRGLLEKLPPGARIAVISFHSLEDRIVKLRFREAVTKKFGRWIQKRPIRPSAVEVRRNPRSRSARLRAIELLPRAEG